MSNKLPFFYILLGLALFTACGDREDDSAAVRRFIDEKVEERLLNYQEIFFRQCQDRVIEKASEIADSLLIMEARLKRDTTLKPPKPIKPAKPGILELADTIPVKPLFEDTTGKRN